MALLSEVKGWSPVIHSLARQDGIGLITAAVYGAVWRYCQMDNKVCTASLETIGGDLGIDKATVLRHIKKLCERGYLKDDTPELRNVPHTYSDTGKVKLTNTIEAQTVAEDNTFSKTVAHSNATVAHSNATVAESQLNRVFNRLSYNNKIQEEEEAPKIRHNDFATVCLEYQQEIGGLSQIVSDAINDDLATYPADWISQAMKRAALANARNYRYVQAILKKWLAGGGPQNDKPKGQGNGHQSKQPRATDSTNAPPAGIDPATWERLNRKG